MPSARQTSSGTWMEHTEQVGPGPGRPLEGLPGRVGGPWGLEKNSVAGSPLPSLTDGVSLGSVLPTD